MRIYQRVTREVRPELLPDEIHAAIQRHFEGHNLGNILAEISMCIETISVRVKTGLFKRHGPQKVTSYAFLTPVWLVYAAVDGKGPVGVMSVKLADATIEDHALSTFYAKFPDRGFHITGNFTGQVGMHGRQQVTLFLALGEEQAAKSFGDALEDAIAKTRR